MPAWWHPHLLASAGLNSTTNQTRCFVCISTHTHAHTTCSLWLENCGYRTDNNYNGVGLDLAAAASFLQLHLSKSHPSTSSPPAELQQHRKYHCEIHKVYSCMLTPPSAHTYTYTQTCTHSVFWYFCGTDQGAHSQYKIRRKKCSRKLNKEWALANCHHCVGKRPW